MMMVFFSATNTPLYSTAWMPNRTGQYAGTCIFLIALSVIFRGLMALRCNFGILWARRSQQQRQGLITHDTDTEYLKQARRPWRVNEAASRAVLDTMLAGVSYLLLASLTQSRLSSTNSWSRMLAVMTMNVGYFLSILGGTFLGSFILGGWTGTAAH